MLKRGELFRGVQRAIAEGFPTGLQALIDRSQDGIRIIADAHIEWLDVRRSEEYTSEPHSLMRCSYAVFCLTKQNSSIICQLHGVLCQTLWCHTTDHFTLESM